MEIKELMKAMITTQGKVRELKPLIHCITNPISIHDCANVVLTAGARPIMAEHPQEVEAITKTANALALNLGNITDARIQSIRISAQTAVKNSIPCILDLVGVGCSSLRKELAQDILLWRQEKQLSTCEQVIKGNMSEIRAMCEEHRVSGVDVSPQDELSQENMSESIQLVKEFAKQNNSVVFVTGATDVVTDGKEVYLIENGSAMMSRITGTGCMSTVLTAAYLAERNAGIAALAAAATFGICGELAAGQSRGIGSFQVNLLDELSEFNPELLRTKAKIRKWENV